MADLPADPSPPPMGSPPPDSSGKFYVLLGLALLVLPLLGLALGFGLYVYNKSDDMLDTYQQIQRVEEEAAQAAQRKRAEREAELLAEFHDAFSRENLPAAAAVLDRLTAEAFDSEQVQACRQALIQAQAAGTPPVEPPAAPGSPRPEEKTTTPDNSIR